MDYMQITKGNLHALLWGSETNVTKLSEAPVHPSPLALFLFLWTLLTTSPKLRPEQQKQSATPLFLPQQPSQYFRC